MAGRSSGHRATRFDRKIRLFSFVRQSTAQDALSAGRVSRLLYYSYLLLHIIYSSDGMPIPTRRPVSFRVCRVSFPPQRHDGTALRRGELEGEFGSSTARSCKSSGGWHSGQRWNDFIDESVVS